MAASVSRCRSRTLSAFFFLDDADRALVTKDAPGARSQLGYSLRLTSHSRPRVGEQSYRAEYWHFRLRGGMGRRCANLAVRPPPAEPSREKIGCTYPRPASWWTVAAATSGLSSKTRRTASARSCAARRRTRQRPCHDGIQRRVNVRSARRRQERAHQRRWRRQRSRRSRCPPAASRSPRWPPLGRSGVSRASPPRVARPGPCRGVS